MPRSKREYLRRYADQALNDLERAIEKFGQLRNEYIDGSPFDEDVKSDLRDDITYHVDGPYSKNIDAWAMTIGALIQIRMIVQSMRDNNI